ncbi:MAG: hypothetical protein LBB60_07160 [Desulfovibrio sp.]|nr:hypothetical protein [Desulfovibrio sp.]
MILVILTSHRMDCFSLCLECLELHTSLALFERIYVMANAPAQEHWRMVRDFARRHGNAKAVYIEPRGQRYVTGAQREILKKHVDSPVVKMDEDVFVTENWLQGLVSTYKKEFPKGCGLVSALVPNNNVGRNVLDKNFRAAFPEYVKSECLQNGKISTNPRYALWLWKNFISGSMVYSRKGLLKGLQTQPLNGRYLNINCILMSPELLGYITQVFEYTTDEDVINTFLCLEQCPLYGVVTPDSVAHHYSFEPQQKELDAHISLSDIRNRLLGDAL